MLQLQFLILPLCCVSLFICGVFAVHARCVYNSCVVCSQSASFFESLFCGILAWLRVGGGFNCDILFTMCSKDVFVRFLNTPKINLSCLHGIVSSLFFPTSILLPNLGTVVVSGQK